MSLRLTEIIQHLKTSTGETGRDRFYTCVYGRQGCIAFPIAIVLKERKSKHALFFQHNGTSVPIAGSIGKNWFSVHDLGIAELLSFMNLE
jgi:hypothetical protein